VARRELRRARVELAYLLTPGAQAQASAAAAGSLRVRGEPRFEPVAVDADAALARARRSRPALAAARSRLEAERAGARAARYARYPDLAVSAGPKRQSLPGATTYGYTAGISIGLPLWNGGGAAAEAQQGRAEQAAAELEAARRRVDVEVRDALQRLDTYRTRRQAVARELPAGSLLEDAVFVYEQGEMSLFELLDAVGAARDAALLRLRLTGRYLRALYDLERALGVGPGDGPVVIDGALDPHAGELS
jgi:cobalt-zinc-cadmium efflux system outer membrane protein